MKFGKSEKTDSYLSFSNFYIYIRAILSFLHYVCSLFLFSDPLLQARDVLDTLTLSHSV